MPWEGGDKLLAYGCKASGTWRCIQHRRECPGADQEGGQGTLVIAVTCCRTKPGAAHTAPALSGQRCCWTLGDGQQEVSGSRLGLTPAKGQVRGGQSAKPPLAWPGPATAASIAGTSVAGGCEGAALSLPGPESSKFSVSKRTAENADYLYRPWRAGGWRETSSPVAICGHDQQRAGRQGTRAQTTHLSGASLNLTKSPLTPLPVTGSRAAAFSPPHSLKILWVTVPLVLSCPPRSGTLAHTQVP